MSKDITVRLKIPVTIYNKQYVAGEPIKNPPKDLLAAWEENELCLEESTEAEETKPKTKPKAEETKPKTKPKAEETKPKTKPKAERATAEGAIGIPEGGTGAEGEMIGRDSRKKVK